MSHVHDFNEYRERMNDRILSTDNLVIKRFFNLDTNTYMEGALPVKTKEMMGLVASMVLRCDDCVRYHIQQCHEVGVTREEFFEIFSVGLVVGGSIVIPHMRRAVEFLAQRLERNPAALVDQEELGGSAGAWVR
jgi:AhpD family alkylhydroperoxidase